MTSKNNQITITTATPTFNNVNRGREAQRRDVPEPTFQIIPTTNEKLRKEREKQARLEEWAYKAVKSTVEARNVPSRTSLGSRTTMALPEFYQYHAYFTSAMESADERHTLLLFLRNKGHKGLEEMIERELELTQHFERCVVALEYYYQP